MSRARLSGCLAAVFWTAVLTPVSAETLPELFSRAKAKVAAGAYAEALATLNQLEAEVQKPENEGARTPLRPAAAFYRGVCLAALGEPDRAREEFAIFIAANPEKDIDRKAYPASVVAAFQQARKSSPGAEKAEEVLSSLALAYRSTAFPSESSAPPGPDWANGPVKHLLRQEESRAFLRLSTAPRGRSSWRGSGARGTPGPTLRTTSSSGSSSGASRSPTSVLWKVRRGAA